MTKVEDIAAALRSDAVLHQRLDDGTGVVLDLESSRVLALNATGMFLVDELIQRSDSVDDLVEALAASFEVDRTTAENDVRGLLEELGGYLASGA